MLDNFKIYEPDVENVKDAITKDIKKASDKFNKDNTDLMFNATSLKHATVITVICSVLIGYSCFGEKSMIIKLILGFRTGG